MVVLLGLTTGMRRGELLALRWYDIDLDEATLRVERSLEDRKPGCTLKSQRQKHGRRTITLATSVIAELRQHRKQHKNCGCVIGIGRAPDDALVFPRFDRFAAQPEQRD